MNDDDLGRQLIYDATKNLRYEVGGHELMGMVVVDVNRNALGEIVSPRRWREIGPDFLL